jgi:hypothetical protein
MTGKREIFLTHLFDRTRSTTEISFGECSSILHCLMVAKPVKSEEQQLQLASHVGNHQVRAVSGNGKKQKGRGRKWREESK